MYPKYFGLSEPSFSITPDPQYLFLSEQHREALAHLLYGASETGGFVLLTGEVGTGKTTVCRAFLEQLPEGVEVALVLNPALTSLELMAAVCDEFGVPVPPHERSTKMLLDRLNTYLLDTHARGHRPVLIIDEAQNLRPVVLEQVRLLTNLETTKRKLLQIFLVGQPELRTLLASDELRQLNQRITARFHLFPLSLAETSAYIRHRLSVAGVERPLFSRAAVRHVQRHSGGVPRLINLICDRALLGAAVSHRLQANAAIVDQAAREVRGSDLSQPWPRRQWLGIAATALMATAVGLWIGASGLVSLPEATEPEASLATVASAAPEPIKPVMNPRLLPVTPDAISNGESAPLSALVGDPAVALAALLRAWGESLPADANPDCGSLAMIGLACERADGRWSDLRRFDRPVALQLTLADGTEGEVVLLGVNEEYALIDAGEGRAPMVVLIAELDQRWSGDYRLLWRPPPSDDRVIGRAATPAGIRWLRAQLRAWPAGDPQLPNGDDYDQALITQVRAFQSAQGLEVDGIAGPRTLILLANVLEQSADADAKEKGETP